MYRGRIEWDRYSFTQEAERKEAIMGELYRAGFGVGVGEVK